MDSTKIGDHVKQNKKEKQFEPCILFLRIDIPLTGLPTCMMSINTSPQDHNLHDGIEMTSQAQHNIYMSSQWMLALCFGSILSSLNFKMSGALHSVCVSVSFTTVFFIFKNFEPSKIFQRYYQKILNSLSLSFTIWKFFTDALVTLPLKFNTYDCETETIITLSNTCTFANWLKNWHFRENWYKIRDNLTMKIKSLTMKIKSLTMKIKTFHMKINSVRENKNFSIKCEL